jgi:hypothetical protein
VAELAGFLPVLAYDGSSTYLHNMAWMLRHGMHCRSSTTRDPNFMRIGNAELIEKRQAHTVPIPPGGLLSDYVPFYFTPWSIMLYNIKTGHNGTGTCRSRRFRGLPATTPTWRHV